MCYQGTNLYEIERWYHFSRCLLENKKLHERNHATIPVVKSNLQGGQAYDYERGA